CWCCKKAGWKRKGKRIKGNRLDARYAFLSLFPSFPLSPWPFFFIPLLPFTSLGYNADGRIAAAQLISFAQFVTSTRSASSAFYVRTLHGESTARYLLR